MKFEIISSEEFENFAKKHKYKSYLQSTAVASLRQKNGWKSHYVGVKENTKLIAASLILSKKRRFKEEFYALRGPLLDYENDELLNFFFINLKKYIKKNNGYFLRIDPYVEIVSRDKDGNITGEFEHYNYKEKLKKIGFLEVPAKKITDTTQAKFMHVIDLKDSIEKTMVDAKSKTRQMIRKNEKNGVIIRYGSKDDIKLFVDIMNSTSERRNFKDRGEKFYKDMYESLINDKMISLVFAELDIEKARKNIEKEKNDIVILRKDRERKIKLGKINVNKISSKIKEEDETLKRLDLKEQELINLESKYGKIITLGGILYILYGDEVASLAGGAYDEFREYQCFYTIHYEMIKYAIEKGYKRYNFYAVHNSLKDDDDQYGIYQFKKGFGGHVIEFMGEFLLPIDKKIFYLQSLIKKIKKLIGTLS